MCGRFTLHGPWKKIHALYRLTDKQPALNVGSHSNICPTDPILIVRQQGTERNALNVRWGLVPPSFDEAMTKKFQNHNARSDKIDKTQWWSKPFTEGRRCLIPASGFYEWKTEGKTKVRHYITSRSGELLTFAGLWERNDKLGITSATMICTEPNALMEAIHDRMPVILAPEDWDSYLAEPRADLLKPAPTDDLIAYPVRSKIADDDPAEVLLPLPITKPGSNGLLL